MVADSFLRRPCRCGLVTHRAPVWEEHAPLWGFPDWLMWHSPLDCFRGDEDGTPLEGPSMTPSPPGGEGER